MIHKMPVPVNKPYIFPDCSYFQVDLFICPYTLPLKLRINYFKAALNKPTDYNFIFLSQLLFFLLQENIKMALVSSSNAINNPLGSSNINQLEKSIFFLF